MPADCRKLFKTWRVPEEVRRRDGPSSASPVGPPQPAPWALLSQPRGASSAPWALLSPADPPHRREPTLTSRGAPPAASNLMSGIAPVTGGKVRPSLHLTGRVSLTPHPPSQMHFFVTAPAATAPTHSQNHFVKQTFFLKAVIKHLVSRDADFP